MRGASTAAASDEPAFDSVRIEATDRAGRERLLRYCARPPFALDRLREFGREPSSTTPRNRAPAAVARSA